mmetsp:Transcript_7376/g.14459  ORF Transcript_7376/g.14459 Transcript_7376/m.14459 type:complete len:95 (-) Transcript_7376:133-417(-)
MTMTTLRSILLLLLFLWTVLAMTAAAAISEEQTKPRRLRRLNSDKEKKELLKQAKEACQYVKKGDRDLCIDDVMTTGDAGMADMWPKSLPKKFD